MTNITIKKSISLKWLILFVVVCTLSIDANEHMFHSLIFPGMGQLSNDQTLKGLGFMTGEITLLTFMMSSVSKYNALSKETKYLKAQFDLSEIYEEKVAIKNDWNESKDLAGKMKMRGYVFGGLALTWWALNVFDIILFADNTDKTVFRKQLENINVFVIDDAYSLQYCMDF